MTIDTDLETNGADTGRRSIKETALDATQRLRERAGDVGEQSRRYADAAGRQLGAAQRRAVETVRAKPVTTATFVLVGAAFLAGAFIALRSPETVKRLAKRMRPRF